MIKHAIRFRENIKHAHLIFHATPNSMEYTWRWFVTPNKEDVGFPLVGEVYESFIIATDELHKKRIEGFLLYCECTHRTTKAVFKTEYIKLCCDVDEIIQSGVTFDSMYIYSQEGAIIPYTAKQKASSR